MPVSIADGYLGTSSRAGVTSRGQVVVSPLEYNDTIFKALNVAATAFNYITPRAGKQFVIDGYIISGTRTVNASNGAAVKIFETDSLTSVTPTREIFNLDITRLSGRNAVGLNILTQPGIWLTATTDSATVNLTILGYFVDVEEVGE